MFNSVCITSPQYKTYDTCLIKYILTPECRYTAIFRLLAMVNRKAERHLHTLMCLVSVVTVVFIHTMEDDQRLNTLVHEGDALRFSVYHCKKPENRCTQAVQCCSTFSVLLCGIS